MNMLIPYQTGKYYCTYMHHLEQEYIYLPKKKILNNTWLKASKLLVWLAVWNLIWCVDFLYLENVCKTVADGADPTFLWFFCYLKIKWLPWV